MFSYPPEGSNLVSISHFPVFRDILDLEWGNHHYTVQATTGPPVRTIKGTASSVSDIKLVSQETRQTLQEESQREEQ